MKELVALVTGAASGIGRAVANKLASRGISVVVADMNEDQGTAVAADIARKYNVRTQFHRVNVAQEAEVKALVAAAAAPTGRLDYAANCAGICESVWDEEESISTELFDRYELSRYCIGLKPDEYLVLMSSLTPEHMLLTLEASGSVKNTKRSRWRSKSHGL